MSLSPQTLKLIHVFFPLLMIVSGLLIYARLAWTNNLESMVSALPSSSWVKLQVLIWSRFGLWGKLMLTFSVSNVLFWPIRTRHIKLRKLNQADIDSFPSHLKRQLLAGRISMYLGVILFALTYYSYK